MATFLMVCGVIVAGVGAVPYIMAVLRGTARPRLVSWAVWAVLAAVLAASSYADGQVASALLSLQAFVACSTVVVLGWKYGGQVKVGQLDVICLVGAALGILSLVMFKNPQAALITALAVDAVAFIPTFVHAWTNPDEESMACYALAAAGAVLATCASVMAGAAFAGLLYPLYSMVFNGVMVLLLVMGRWSIAQPYNYANDEA